MAAEFEALKKSVDHTSDSMKKSTTFAQYLDRELVKQKDLVRALGQEFAKTGDIDVFKNLRAAEKDLKKLEKFTKEIAKATTTGIQTGAQDGAKTLSQAFADLPPQAQIGIGAAVAAGIVVAAAPIGAAINGVLLAGVGLGGVAAGVVGQLHDPLVEKAFSDLKTTSTDVLTASTKSFAPILVGAAHQFEDGIIKAEPKLEAAFDRLAPHAAAVFGGLERAGAAAAPGFLEALDASGPILDQIGQDLPGLGHAFSTFFHSIAGGAGGAKDAVHDLFIITEATTEAIGYTVEGLSKAFTIEEAFGELLRGDVGAAGQKLSDLVTNTHAGADAAANLAGRFQDMAADGQLAAAALDRINGGLSTLIGNQLSVDQASDRFAEDLLNLTADLDAHSRSLDGNSAAGLHNRDVILQLIADAQQARDAQIQMAGGADASKDAVDKANTSYDAAIAKIEDMGQKAGLSKKDLDNLAGQYEVDVILAVNAINNSPLNQLTHAHDPNRASGGPVAAGVPYVVGENGPELFLSATPGTIIPNDIAKRLTATAPRFRPGYAVGGSGGTITFAGNLDSAFATAFQYLVRTGQIQIN
jgi:hypothetical protein